MSTFAPTRVEYYETRAAEPYEWWVRYDLGFNGRAIDVTLDIRLWGADAGAERIGEWNRGINEIWNHKLFVSDGQKLYELHIDSSFVTGGEHQTVQVYSGQGGGNMDHWFELTAWGPEYVDEFAAHEFGHMLGAFDEYGGGATLLGYNTYGTLMADFTVEGAKNFERYVEGILAQTESRSGLELEAVLSHLGGDLGETMDGSAGLDGFYGMGGDDTINGRAGNDFLAGGPGGDSLIGAHGHDILKGGAGADQFVFTARNPGSSDQLRDFNPAVDLLVMQNSAFTGIGSAGALLGYRLLADAQVDELGATRPGQRFLYDTDSGRLWYDADGSGAAEKTLVARLSGAPHLDAGDFLVI